MHAATPADITNPRLACSRSCRSLRSALEACFLRGVERAAESVLGDDTDALRLARQELDQLTDQLRQEMTRTGNGNTNTNQLASLAAASGRPSANNPSSDRTLGPGQSTNDLASAQARV